MENSMTLDKLISELQYMKEKHGGDVKVIFDSYVSEEEYPINNLLETYQNNSLIAIKLTDLDC